MKRKMDLRIQHRIFRTVYFIVIVGIFAMLTEIFYTKSPVVGLKLTFLFALCCFVLYELVIVKHVRDRQLRENAAHQAYIGIIAIASGVIAFILDIIFMLALENSLLILSIVTIVMLLLTINRADDVISKYV
jgi:hypothetical protein